MGDFKENKHEVEYLPQSLLTNPEHSRSLIELGECTSETQSVVRLLAKFVKKPVRIVSNFSLDLDHSQGTEEL
jgi:hypothetical protein